MNKLFTDFDSVSAKAWKQKIQVDLKGADYNKTLIWQTPEGIDVKPFYHSEDFITTPKPSNSQATQWNIGEPIKVSDAKIANKAAIEAVSKGADCIGFYLTSKNISIPQLLNNIDTKTLLIDIFTSDLSVELSKYIEHSMVLHTDSIGYLAKTGNWVFNRNNDFKTLTTIVENTKQLSINADLYQNAGANIVQQLAYTLAHANEYLNHLYNDNSFSQSSLEAIRVTFNVAVGSNYFFEIAKLRALRQLWQTLANEYGTNTNCRIIAKPSLRNKTIYDYNVNMLRTTTECMSAILGGANTIYNTSYDTVFNTPNDFGNRIGRNQLLVLKHESYFNKVNNPADGAYYIESLTEDLAQKALVLFKDIEANGGFLYQLKEGTIQRKIKENATKEQTDFDTEKMVLLGTNKHPNQDDKMKNNLEIDPFLKIEKRKTLIEPILQKRLAEQMEAERLKNE